MFGIEDEPLTRIKAKADEFIALSLADPYGRGVLIQMPNPEKGLSTNELIVDFSLDASVPRGEIRYD